VDFWIGFVYGAAALAGIIMAWCMYFSPIPSPNTPNAETPKATEAQKANTPPR
jgi:hypothetical protein